MQNPLLKDLEDIGDKCGNCKPPVQGLSYKKRNKKLIEDHEKKQYKRK